MEPYTSNIVTDSLSLHPKDVFVCYSDSDTVAARRITAWLEGYEGVSCWFAERDMPTNSNEAEIRMQMIEQSSIFLLISSCNTHNNQNVLLSVSHAMALEIDRIEFKLSAAGLPIYGAIQSNSHPSQNPDADWELATYTLGRQINKKLHDTKDGPDELESIEAAESNRRPNFAYMIVLLIFVIGGVMTYTSLMPEQTGLDNLDEANDILSLAHRAEAGNITAQYEYGRMMMIVQRFDEATYWFRQAAESGHTDAQMALATNYRDGIGIERDYEQALYWFDQAGALHHPTVQYETGVRYQHGFDLPQDFELAVYWYRRAAEQGHTGAMAALAWMYESSQFMRQDIEQAVYWRRQAAMEGDLNAQYRLGQMYLWGEGVAQSYEQTIYWFTKAAEQGLIHAMSHLGFVYEFYGVTDYEQAVYWYSKAAELGDTQAMNMYGVMLYNGRGVEQDHEAAMYWFRKAEQNGFSHTRAWAAAYLAIMYEEGAGVEQSYEQAIYWLERALTYGPYWVEARLQRLLEHVET